MRIEFYTTPRKRSPVTDFIDKQPKQDQAVILAVLQDIADEGYGAKGCQFKQLEGKLWEIKIKAPSGGYRLIYVTLTGDLMLVLHSFKKKTQKTPKKELNIARKRLKEIL
ncbi:MAG: type II toxin-antitoxin system RelE/ParE family toxin [Epsilonproteobacteria bacterium]|nr:MAG: type II toxin-antitoxin system RelE/ParE family toxin [Campylobacterota bacterium]RLA68187.1 MAG: type II toxin-antitoxin system RelE/ParE family toxin [Campylobacterota bacterium]